MKTLKEFDYDLWATEDGSTKRYWVRVKLTGEVSEVSQEVMTLLWNEEKRMRRGYLQANIQGGTPLSYDAVPIDESSIWLMDPTNTEDNILFNLYLKEFRSLLTPVQLCVLDDCLLAGVSIREYAKLNDRNHKSIQETVEAIRNKYKKYFL